MRDKQKYNEYQADYQLKRYHRRRGLAIERLGGKCVHCGSVDDLELDHVDPRSKSYNMGKIWSFNEALFLSELEKCQLLCSACHRLKSIDDQGHNQRSTHGTFACYRHQKCRCDACKAEASRYQKERRELRSTASIS